MRQRANTDPQEDETHLFLLRLWADDTGDGQRRWQGKVQNIVYGEAHNFREWSALIDCLLQMLPSLQAGEPSNIEGAEQC